MEQLKSRRDRVAEDLQLDPGVIAPRQALERIKAMEEPAIGPYPASIESLETKPAFRSAATAEDPEAARGVYASQVELPSDGDWRAAAV